MPGPVRACVLSKVEICGYMWSLRTRHHQQSDAAPARAKHSETRGRPNATRRGARTFHSALWTTRLPIKPPRFLRSPAAAPRIIKAFHPNLCSRSRAHEGRPRGPSAAREAMPRGRRASSRRTRAVRLSASIHRRHDSVFTRALPLASPPARASVAAAAARRGRQAGRRFPGWWGAKERPPPVPRGAAFSPASLARAWHRRARCSGCPCSCG